MSAGVGGTEPRQEEAKAMRGCEHEPQHRDCTCPSMDGCQPTDKHYLSCAIWDFDGSFGTVDEVGYRANDEGFGGAL